MLVYANQTPEATEALPPLVTMVVEAIVFQSVTTFCACKRCIVSNAVARHTKVRKHFIRFTYDVCLRPTRHSGTTSECFKTLALREQRHSCRHGPPDDRRPRPKSCSRRVNQRSH